MSKINWQDRMALSIGMWSVAEKRKQLLTESVGISIISMPLYML